MPMTMSERLDHARAALTGYFEAKGEPLPEGPWDYEDTATSDLIADLLHLQKRLGLRGTEQTIQTAMLHFEAEEEEEPGHVGNDQSRDVQTHGLYIVGSSHGELTTDAEGSVISRNLDNNDADGGGHLAQITRFDLAEWRRYWKQPLPEGFDILDVGYWYTDPTTGGEPYASPEADWRTQLAESLLERHKAATTEPPAKKIITVHVEGGLVQDVNGVPRGYELRVEDYDVRDPGDDSWDAEKECAVTIYEGDAV